MRISVGSLDANLALEMLPVLSGWYNASKSRANQAVQIQVGPLAQTPSENEMRACLAVVAAVCFSWPALAVSPTPGEMAACRAWFDRHLGPNAATLPFSFSYAGRPSSDLLGLWRAERVVEKLDANRMRCTLTFTDRKTGLTVRCVAIEYSDFPTVEWTVYFKNTGHVDTAILNTPGPWKATWMNWPEKRG